MKQTEGPLSEGVMHIMHEVYAILTFLNASLR
jgi:hypothetical protein